MKIKKVSIGYWIALAFIGLSLFSNLTNREEDGETAGTTSSTKSTNAGAIRSCGST
jgi:hypothetical protein